MAISVIDAVSAAFRRTGRVLFQPFDLGKWFVLGFCAWLAQLGEGGGGGGNFNVPGGGPGGGGGGGSPFREPFEEAFHWVEANLAVVLIVAAAVVLVVVAISLLIVWLQCRGRFMFLDGVVRNRGAVVEPWHRYRRLANSLLLFRLVVGALGFGAILFAVLLGLAIAWADIEAETFGAAAVIGIVTAVLLTVVVAVTLGVVRLLVNDFVVPVMYLRDVRIMAGLGLFDREILRGHVGKIVVFYLMKIVLVMGMGVAAMIVTCVTCCLAALPYLGTVILLPLPVFLRSYSLHFLDQFGDGWRVFPPEASAAAPAASAGPVAPGPLPPA